MSHARNADDGRFGQRLRCGLGTRKRRQRIEAAGDEERRNVAHDRLVHGFRGSGHLPDGTTILVEAWPAADALPRNGERIARERFLAGRGEILWGRERIAFATTYVIR